MEASLEAIPLSFKAYTGFVGIRLPNHPAAYDFKEGASRPVAAPSADESSRVPPLTAEHVYNDFHRDSGVLISNEGCCNFGVESTVLKLQTTEVGNEETEFELVIIRKGGVSVESLKHVIAEMGLETYVAITQLGQKHT